MVAGAVVDPPATRAYRVDIDGLRAISILLVVAFHAGLAGFEGGYVGVDVFFVISGYLITGLLVRELRERGRISLADFFARRIRRLLPQAALVLLVTLAAGLWLLPPLARVDLLRDAGSAALYVANWRFANQATAYSDAAVTDSLLLHYWSLSVEEQFYVLWPLLVVVVGVLVWRRRPRLLDAALIGVLGVIVVASLGASLHVTAQHGPEAYYVTHTRLWEMGAGALLALLLPRLTRLPRMLSEGFAVLGVALIVLAALWYSQATAFPGAAALIPVTGTMLVIVAGSRQQTSASRLLTAPPMPYLGRLSYAWYLWHWPLIGLALLFNDRHGAPLTTEVTTALAVAGSLGLAAATHALVENRVRYSAWLRGAPRRSFAFGAAATALPVVAAGAFFAFGDIGDEIHPPGPEPEVAAQADDLDARPAQGVLGNGAPLASDRLRPDPVHDDDAPGKEAPGGGPDAEPVLTMSPMEASDDGIEVGPPDCHIGQRDAEPNFSCILGDPEGEATVVLLGDSHARHWLPALDAAGKQRSWRVVSHTKSACTPVDAPILNTNFEREYHECRQWRHAVVDALQAADDIDLVVVARAYGYTETLLDEDGAEARPQDFARLWSAAASRTFEDLRRAADRVLVLRDTPWAPEDVPTCMSESPDTPSDCDLSLEEHAGLDEPLYEAERSVAPDQVRFADPTPLVCAQDPCPMVTADGLIKYRDRHHLTETYSRRLADGLGALLGGHMPGR